METISPSWTLFKFLVSFFLLNIPTQASETFLVLGPTAPVQTSVGGEAVLLCHLSPAQTAQHMQVVWSKSQDVVHRYQEGEDHLEDQTPNFQGRTELVKDAIAAGNVTLRIWNVKPSDAGQYKCFFNDYSHSAEAFMELKVIEAPTLFETYPVWWSVIGILALGQLSILFYYSWKTYQFRENFLVNWTHKVGVMILAVFWCLLMSFLIYYIVNMSGCRGMEDLDEWVQKDQVYLALLTFLPLLPTLLFVAVDFHGKRKERGNTAQNQPSESLPLDTRRGN
ncbi:myelin-oligodendrocyte glycoprotein-like [Phascolarctos cinereus]|uniref:Myelin-oligodendrocyte glycoprotein-like n=1 Tax=Phascolarctos cinereus TaxID=38626 RepID=A0A6P5KXY2_PHACI|nr:myelin-oligodendrocyte glycoprotein-like [Phascolarctos cinereus]XP_020850817.1 myelin-oligodendrocyte glycoprotein-like [Phascolarctos cinereus]XP_020850818.1 myelin-oligodendrocyte glycoprotein-like [Phascolarctos cinereus]